MTDPRFTLEQKLRTAHVKRWQIVRVGREQTLAEHHYLVYHITREVVLAIHGQRMMLAADRVTPATACAVDYTLAQEWALMHDVPEVVTGDIATPAKRAMREAVPHEDAIRRIELQLDKDYADLYTHLKTMRPWVLQAVKLADVTEAMRFLAFEGQGMQARDALLGLFEAYLNIQDEGLKRWPGYAWVAVTPRVLSKIVLPELRPDVRVEFNRIGYNREGGFDAFA